ncbi:MAG: GNAT family N-acetyltransferase [Desulfuromonadales bacterium]|nr:GNAT family N-acetyltransferase [Desulfuromonadales bacterium]
MFNLKKYVVYDLDADRFKPFDKTFGPVTIERITPENVFDVIHSFPEGKVPVFKEKLQRGHVGVFARNKEKVVGYMWSRLYDSPKTVKADGYVPLIGRFSHIHFAHVVKEMRGRGLQLLMATWLIRDSLSKEAEKIYTDIEVENEIAMRGMRKIGFAEKFRFVALRPKYGPCLCFKYSSKAS